MPPFEDDDPPELRIKKYEHLYALGKEALADEVRRLERVESKVHRLLYLLTIVVGAAAIGMTDFLLVLHDPNDPWAITFTASYSLLLLAALLAIGFLFLALGFGERVPLPLDDAVIQHYDRNRYIDVLYSMSRGFKGRSRREPQRDQSQNRGRKVGLSLSLPCACPHSTRAHFVRRGYPEHARSD